MTYTADSYPRFTRTGIVLIGFLGMTIVRCHPEPAVCHPEPAVCHPEPKARDRQLPQYVIPSRQYVIPSRRRGIGDSFSARAHSFYSQPIPRPLSRPRNDIHRGSLPLLRSGQAPPFRAPRNDNRSMSSQAGSMSSQAGSMSSRAGSMSSRAEGEGSATPAVSRPEPAVCHPEQKARDRLGLLGMTFRGRLSHS